MKTIREETEMADEKRNRDQQQGGDEQQDPRIRRDRNPSGSESPGSGGARKENEDRQQE
jgi:hypothetical protein